MIDCIMVKSEILKSLKDVCATSVRLPENMDLSISSGFLNLKLSGRGVLKNMQDNSSAFEGWAVCIMSYFDSVEKVVLDWESPEFSKDGKEVKLQKKHYNRFLLRVLWCMDNYEWFSVDSSKNQELDCFSRIHEKLILNYPNSESKNKSDFHPSDKIKKKEAVLETKIYNKMNEQGCCYANHQLPVGLFDNFVKSEYACTPSIASQIDLWQIENETFRVFELKIPENTTVGIISELMFYANVMRRLFLSDEICYPKQINKQNLEFRGLKIIKDAIGKVKKIEAVFLSDKLHVLIDKNLEKILEILNGNERNISYKYNKVSDYLG